MERRYLHRKLLGLFVKTKGGLSKPLLGGVGHVFMLHRILPQDKRNAFTINKSLAITSEALERWIVFLKEKDYEFISLDEMYLRIIGKKKSRKKFVAFTIDDGYKDNLQHGLPVFEKYSVPFSIFVASCFPNKTAIYWWYLLEHQFLNHSSITLYDGGIKKTFAWKNNSEAMALYQTVREICKRYNKEMFLRFVSESIAAGEEINTAYQQSLALSWSEIKELATHPLVTIGAHTQNHLSLNFQSWQTSLYEIQENKKEIESYIQMPVTHFAYPYGSKNDVSRKEYEILQELGFKTALYNVPGSVFKSNDIHQFQLPRMGLTDETSQERMNNFLNGITHFREHGFRKNISE